LAGQIILYGSVGTASSAVVYFLQDQIRQVQRLKQLLESKKRFADALRKHGVSEATIQRMRKATLEDHIQDLERRGLVRLELVDEPPKWTSSPHKGQMYHIEYLPIKSNTRKSRTTTLQSSNDYNSELAVKSDLEEKLLRWWDDTTVPVASMLKRHGKEIFMRKHWVDRIENRRYTTSTASFQSWPGKRWSSRTTATDFSNLARVGQLSHLFHVAWYSQAVGQSTPIVMSIIPEMTDAIGVQPSVDKNMKQIFLEFFQKWDSTQVSESGEELDANTMNEKVLKLMSMAQPSSQLFQEASYTMEHIFDIGLMQVEDALSILLKRQAYVQLLAFFETLPQHYKHPKSSSIVLHTLFKILDANTHWLIRQKSTQMLDFFLKSSTAFQLESAFQILDSRQQLTSPLLDLVFGATISRHIAVLQKVITALSTTSHDGEIGTIILHAVDNCAQEVTNETLIKISGALEYVQREDSAGLQSKLCKFAVRTQCFSAAVTIFQRHFETLSSKESSGTPLDIRSAYLSLSDHEATATDMRKFLDYFKRCKQNVIDSLFPSIVKRYCLQHAIASSKRADYLTEATQMLSPDRATAILLALPVQVDSGLGAVVHSLRINALTRLSARGDSDEDVQRIYVAIQQSLSNTGENLLPLNKAMIHASLAAGRKQLAATVAKAMYTDHEEIHSSWDEMIDVMVASANVGKSQDIIDMLHTLDEKGHVTSKIDKKLSFCSVYFALASHSDPNQWLDFAEHCFKKYGFFFGPKTFDKIAEQSIILRQSETCRDNLLRLIRLSSSQPYDVGVRQRTVAVAIHALLKRDGKEEREIEGAFFYRLFKKVCKVNERLVSQDLASLVIDALQQSDKKDATVMQNQPRTFGQRWGRGHYDWYRMSRLELRKQTIDLVLSRLPNYLGFADESRGIFPETSKAFFQHEANAFKEMRQVYRELQRILRLNEPQRVVEIFDDRISNGLVIDKFLLRVAVEACLVPIHGKTDRTRAWDYINMGKTKGVDTAMSEMIMLQHAILNKDTWGPRTIRKAVFGWYHNKIITHPQLAHNVLHTAIVRLTGNHRKAHRGRHRTYLGRNAIKLMLEVHASKFAEAVPFGIKEYTAFMTAYFQCKDYEGVNWVVATVLKKNLPISVSFMHVLTRDSVRATSEIAKQGGRTHERRKYAEARQSHWLWRNLKNVCHRRRLTQRELVRKAQTETMNILLYDAVHPDVDDVVHITAPRVPGVLDTKVSNVDRDASMQKIKQAKMARAEAVKNTQIASTRAWRSVHADSVEHPISRKNMDNSPLELLQAMEALGSNTHKAGKQIYEDDLVSDTASVASIAADDSGAIAWTSMDTRILEVLKETVAKKNLMAGRREDLDLEKLVMEIKQAAEFKSVRFVDTALEQMIRNKENVPGVYGLGDRIWKDVMKRNMQTDWARAGS
jgi:hypothetical protein